MNDDNVYYWLDSFGGINGPELRSRLQELHRQNVISDNTEVCILGSNQWLPYKTISSAVISVSECNQQSDHEAKETGSIRHQFSTNQSNKENNQPKVSFLSKRKTVLVVLSVLALLGCFLFVRLLFFMWLNCDSILSLIARTPKEMKQSYNIDLDGSVFVVTKNGHNFKLGLVAVRVCESRRLSQDLIRDTHADIERHYPMEWSTSDEYMRSEHAAHVNILETMSPASKQVSWEKVLRHIKERSAALPPAVSVALTDADGKFNMSVPPTVCEPLPLIDAAGNYKMSARRVGKCSLVAFAERQVFDKTERYLWIIPLSAESKQTIMLSNHNMISDFDDLFAMIRLGFNWP